MKDDNWTPLERATNRIGMAAIIGGITLILLTRDSASRRRWQDGLAEAQESVDHAAFKDDHE